MERGSVTAMSATRARLLSVAVALAAAGCGSKGSTAAGGPPDATGASSGPDGGGAAVDGAAGGEGPDGATDASNPCVDGATAWRDPGLGAPVADPALAGVTHQFFAIHVVDGSDAPVVGATLTTTNQTVYTTDENGNVAYYEPGLMGTDVWFGPACAGYTYPTDAYGNSGTALHPTEGGSGTITMTRSGTVTAPAVGDLQTRLLAGAVPGPAQCFAIRAVDSVTLRGVPLVKFAPASGEAQWSDSQGMVAYCDPDSIGTAVTFTVTTDGYALASGTQITLTATAGGSQTVPLVREVAGECLYRVTGQGIYRDSILLGLKTPVAHPDINGLVMGQDTPSTFVYEGTLYWLWQDTERAAYPLGNFDTSGATSVLPDDGGLSPDLGSNTTYFVDSNGFSRGMVDTTADPMASSGQAAGIWLGNIVPVVDSEGQPQIFGTYYANAKNPWSALAELDAGAAMFDYVADYPAGAPIPAGRSNLVKDVGGTTYAYWSNPVRFPATVAGVTDFAGYQVFSAYPGDGGTTLATTADGGLAYAWTAGATPVTSARLTTAQVNAGLALDGHVTDIASGSGVQVANDSSMWNDYRKRFSKIIQQEYGTSFLGESWYIEGDTPLGPWVYARKVVTHDDGYTFYNPNIIPYFSEAGGRIIFYDATYTAAYTSLTPTPRYNYNEMMYRLDLDDPRLVLPVAVYEAGAGSAEPASLVTKGGVRVTDPAVAPAFFAYDRPAPGSVPVAWNGASCVARRLVAGGQPATTPVFYAMPAGTTGDAGAGPALVPLYEYSGPNGVYLYSVDAALGMAGYQRGAAIASVWPSPIAVALPVADFLGDLVANAGPDQCVTATGNGGATVTLDGSASRDLAGPIAQYLWMSAATGCVLATGESAEVALPAGLNDVFLEVTDAQGNTSTDHVLVAVAN
jgi:hypothetical protein